VIEMKRVDNLFGGGIFFLLLILFSWSLNPVILGCAEQPTVGGVWFVFFWVVVWYLSLAGVCYNAIKLTED